MKKLLFLASALSVLLLASCSNNYSDDNASAPAPEDRTPGEYIERNKKLSVLKEITLSTSEQINFSNYEGVDYTGKKVFMTIINPDEYNNYSFHDNVNIIQNTIKNVDISNGHYLNVPYNPPHIPITLKGTSPYTINKNMYREDSTTEPSIGDIHNFIAGTDDNKTNTTWAANCVLKVKGKHCYVWYKEKTGIDIKPEKLQSLATTFDSLYEIETYIFGDNYLTEQPDEGLIDVTNPDTKINIIVYDLFNDLEKTKADQAGTFGYFWDLDFSKEDEVYKGITYYSNKCQCLHIDSYFLEVSEKQQQSTIAHEFQHLLHYVNKTLKNKQSDGTFKYSDTWFNEMMSMVCEDIMQSQIGLEDWASPKARLSLFNQTYYMGFGKWRNSDDVYVSYANAYAFGAYLLRNFGIDFIKYVATNEYLNDEAIEQAYHTLNPDTSLEYNLSFILKDYYNAVLNPKETEYTLNKTATETYNIAGKDVTFTCSAINLFDYVTIPAEAMTPDLAESLYQGSKYRDYKGPVILNNKYFNSLDPYGMQVSYLGIIGEDIWSYSWNSKLKYSNNIYKLVIIE